MIFFTADEHYGHKNAIKHSSRPFSSVDEMNDALINNHNLVVGAKDTVVHCGDFTLIGNYQRVSDQFISKLNGNHIFLRGSHDEWLKRSMDAPFILERKWQLKKESYFIVACHYAMRTWRKSHYNSWHVYGHSHGSLESFGKSYDVGVDNNDYYPVSLEQLVDIMENLPDNFNKVEKRVIR